MRVTCYNSHEHIFAGAGPAWTRGRQPLQRVEGVEVDKVGAAEAGDDWEPASVQGLTGGSEESSVRTWGFAATYISLGLQEP